MPTTCAVKGCKNRTTDKTLSFYRFPKLKKNAASDIQNLSEKQRDAWLKSLKRYDIANKNVDVMRICSTHFISGKDLYNLSVKCIFVYIFVLLVL